MANSNKNEQGFTIIELLIALSIIGFVAILSLQHNKQVREEDQARSIGHQLSIYNNAVRNHISVNLDNDEYINNVETVLTGVNWLKNEDQCEGGQSSGYFLPCEFPEFVGSSNLTYSTTIYADLGEGKLRAKTVIDVKSPDGNTTVIGSTQLGLAMMTASGGRNGSLLNLNLEDTTLQLDGDNNPSTNILLTNTDAGYLYCPFGVNNSLLSSECSIDGNTIEDGLIVMMSETSGANDSLIRVDGSNTMNNRLRMESEDAERRQIIGSSSIYNLTGEILKLGNSGIYFDDGWVPIIGDGLVIDTDMKVVGSSFIKGDLENAGDILVSTNIITERSLLAGRDIISQSDLEVLGKQYILGQANYNSDLAVFGTVDAVMMNVRTFAEANEISAINSINSDTIINSPIVRASSAMFSERGMVVSGDSLTSGNSYVSGNRATAGSIVANNDVIADRGTAYLGNIFASAIFDPSGDYLIDPSGISRTNIVRAENIVSSTSGSRLDLNGNRMLFAREDINCNTISEDCATKVSGYVDMEKIMIKSPGDGSWISFIQYLNGLETYLHARSEREG